MWKFAKITDFDGKFSYSRLVYVNNETKGNIRVYPNPTSGNITLEGIGLLVNDIKLYSVVGKNVTSNISIITSADIEQRGYKTISDALKTVPGINFSRYGGLGTATNINIRGIDKKNRRFLFFNMKNA